MNTGNNNAHLALHGMLVAFLFCAAVGGFFHFAPVHDEPTPPIPAPVTDCLPSGSGGECIPFNQLIQQMQDTPEVIPAHPATVNEETI